ncbi:MAG: electron transporter [Microbacterium sp. 71-36]|uniref:DM13 domain-containing protein n=1 Tax=unclassified Microbacterium TaxID=2609290 RepID=UPI00086CEB41|nr:MULTISPECIES: DM13 domain-containing protein [unclassified Microbacterium]MBN9213009.1 DM13 domain-containing protein [Microbacterium sp.]ODT36820.1 MAG: electron transporter [Microbacterium sp. SCN 71-17]OJV77707.1 MAG: electron transporter [Microbacterium sp. 71-36]
MPRSRTVRRHRWWWIGGGAVLVAAVIAGLVFQPWLLFVDVRVDDEIPAAATPVASPAAASVAPEPVDVVTPAPPAGPVDLLTGSLISHEHETSGAVRVIENPDGSRQLALVGLQTTNGPDVHVWLSAGPVVEGRDGWYTAADYDRIDLGPIKGNLGDQLYDIPADADLTVFRSVDLWCVQFGVSFGAAALT